MTERSPLWLKDTTLGDNNNRHNENPRCMALSRISYMCFFLFCACFGLFLIARNKSQNPNNEERQLLRNEGRLCNSYHNNILKCSYYNNTHWYLKLPDPQSIGSITPRFKHLPRTFDWSNYNNLSLVTPVRDQNTPQQCGSCWAFASTSALSDRLKIASYRLTLTEPEDIILSPQVLLNCGEHSFGTCHGGDPRYAYKWIYENGITEDKYTPYTAKSNSSQCQCHHCYAVHSCLPLDKPERYYIKEYGTFYPKSNLVEEMMNQIYAYGPIVSGMFSFTDEFHQFRGGYILNDTSIYNRTTHEVTIVGWSEENDHNYWIVKNSFGVDWGENGYFRIIRGMNTMNIETQGVWAVPKL